MNPNNPFLLTVDPVQYPNAQYTVTAPGGTFVVTGERNARVVIGYSYVYRNDTLFGSVARTRWRECTGVLAGLDRLLTFLWSLSKEIDISDLRINSVKIVPFVWKD